jgi:hypothetical protein
MTQFLEVACGRPIVGVHLAAKPPVVRPFVGG